MSGITDETAIEGHDLIHNTEVDEERLHEHDVEAKGEAKPDASGATSTGSAEGGQKESTLHKVKEAFHRQTLRAEEGV